MDREIRVGSGSYELVELVNDRQRLIDRLFVVGATLQRRDTPSHTYAELTHPAVSCVNHASTPVIGSAGVGSHTGGTLSMCYGRGTTGTSERVGMVSCLRLSRIVETKIVGPVELAWSGQHYSELRVMSNECADPTDYAKEQLSSLYYTFFLHKRKRGTFKS